MRELFVSQRGKGRMGGGSVRIEGHQYRSMYRLERARTPRSHFHYLVRNGRYSVGGMTYRLARNGILRSENVFAHNINVKQNDTKTVPTRAKNEICIGQVVNILYKISHTLTSHQTRTHPLTKLADPWSLTSRSGSTIDSSITPYTTRSTPSTD
jgi:hypothetical protein